MHDDRCEADWNDGGCACGERAENASLPWCREPDHRVLMARLVAAAPLLTASTVVDSLATHLFNLGAKVAGSTLTRTTTSSSPRRSS